MSSSAAADQSVGVLFEMSVTPLASIPKLPSSVAMPIMPILPLYFGSNSDSTLVMSSLMYFVLYPMHV